LYQQWRKAGPALMGPPLLRLKPVAERRKHRGKMALLRFCLSYESSSKISPGKAAPNQAALTSPGPGVRGCSCRFAAAVADARVCAWSRKALMSGNGVFRMKSLSFDAVESADARVLILGTLPGVRSLEQGEYYAHLRNCFWWIMGELVGASPEMAYADRLNQLRKSGIALWDVCRSAERAGSSDANILLPTVEPNDFLSFLANHPRIELICFNGHPAEKLFRSKVAPSLTGMRPIPLRVLDSTSPASARVTREEKLSRWRECLAPFIYEGVPRRKGLGDPRF
jgi:hypoxanthine-DNA glycosylase